MGTESDNTIGRSRQGRATSLSRRASSLRPDAPEDEEWHPPQEDMWREDEGVAGA